MLTEEAVSVPGVASPLGGRTDLHVFPRGTVNAEVYRDDILDACVRPYAGATGDVFLLRYDNARQHGVRIVGDYLQQETILCMERSAQSSALNTIKHLWGALGRRLAALKPPPQTLAELQLFCESNDSRLTWN